MRADRNSFLGDRPWQFGQPDWFGLKEFASSVASSLVAGGANAGLVVGIDGKWGSGKSSLLNMILSDLADRPNETRPITIQFRPWLVGDRDGLLGSLFGELERAIAQIERESGNSSRATVDAAKDIGKKLRQFGARLSAPAKLLSLAGLAHPGLAVIGEIVGKVSDAAKEEVEGPALAELKDDLTNSLAALGRPIIVTVDDVDRLEPAEVWEILRLIRAVADFPNVTYVLCYDHSVISKSVGAIAQLADGAAFLEKIIQVVIPVPSPEAFQLRHWFRSELAEFALPRSDDEHQRLLAIIDREGGRRLKTPRAVVRALNAIRLFWPALQEAGADLADTVWLQLIKTADPAYYKWVERYSDNFAVTRSGRAMLTKDQKFEELAELKRIYEDDGLKYTDEIFFLDSILPGIETFSVFSDDKSPIYGDVSKSAVEKSIRDRRLSSPDHYRLYFALAQPDGAPKQADYEEAWAALDLSSKAFAELLMRWHEQGPVEGQTKATSMLDRLGSSEGAQITNERMRRVLLALSHVTDDAARKCGDNEFYGPEIWNAAERVLRSFLPRLPARGRQNFVATVFGGEALGWLTSLFRHEYFAHGRYGSQRLNEDEWVLSDPELDAVTRVMQRRYRSMKIEALFAAPRPLSIMFAWQQTGGDEAPKKFIERSSRTDKQFIEVLESLTGRVLSSPGGLLVTLTRENIGSFLDFDQMRARLAKLAAGKSKLAGRAKRLDDAANFGERYG